MKKLWNFLYIPFYAFAAVYTFFSDEIESENQKQKEKEWVDDKMKQQQKIPRKCGKKLPYPQRSYQIISTTYFSFLSPPPPPSLVT